jgi:hypothetical protein
MADGDDDDDDDVVVGHRWEAVFNKTRQHQLE